MVVEGACGRRATLPQARSVATQCGTPFSDFNSQCVADTAPPLKSGIAPTRSGLELSRWTVTKQRK